MLSLGARILYLDEIRPPDGYRLDYAMAATYSLDLFTLLTAPLSMALFECQSEEDVFDQPVSVIEALRRLAGRICIFCQRGQIKVPKQQHQLFSYLESAVVEVQLPNKEGVFHPKVWVLRFTGAKDDPVLYRLLCLSRNLTFDRSWDTILVLEGELNTQRRKGYGRNRLLGEFIAELPKLAGEQLDEEITAWLVQVAEEVRRVQFQLPDGMSERDGDEVLQFVPLGTEKAASPPDFKGCARLLVVSPFLNDTWVKNMLDIGAAETILVSRQDSLDNLSEGTYARLQDSDTALYTMDDAAEHPEVITGFSPEDDQIDDGRRAQDIELSVLHGLHAKLYIAEYNKRHVYLWTGSANATTSAFSGRNVEFMVRLYGTAARIGIDRMLAETEEEAKAESFMGLLCRYQRSASTEAEDPFEKEIEIALEHAQKAISDAGFQLVTERKEDNLYTLRLKLTGSCPIEDGVQARCVPITMAKTASRGLHNLLAGEPVEFVQLPPASLTQFMAFFLVVTRGGHKGTTSFVLKLPIEGLPEDRDDHILHTIVNSTEKFLHYISFLLSGDGTTGLPPKPPRGPQGPGGVGWTTDYQLPLFEELVRAFSRQPEVIERIEQLVNDFKKYPQGSEVIPEEFLKLWDSFLAARHGEIKSYESEPHKAGH